MTKISVCIPTYNQAHYLEQAIHSACEQTTLPYEIIVSDDCSSDDTQEILKRLSNEISFLKIISHSKNLGIAANTDECLRVATGDFIVRLDSDDYLAPRYIERLSELLLKNPTAGYAHANVYEIDQNGHFLKQRRLFAKSGFQTSKDALRSALKGYRVAANIIMFRRSALEKVNYLRDRPDFGEDYHLSASISAAGFGNVYLSEVLSYYRVWVDVSKVRKKRKLAEINGLRRVFEEVLEPAYKKNGWSLNSLKRSKTHFACIHANCLSWKIYTLSEKKILANELYKLSNSMRTRFFTWSYSNGFGKLMNLFAIVKAFCKSIIKGFFLNLRFALKLY
jgi:glycosyltransferase involved in cell wall biosynthesis